MCMSLYLTPHADRVVDAVRVAGRRLRRQRHTIAEAVGSDVTDVVRAASRGRLGAAASC